MTHEMVKRRLRCVLVRTCGIRTANTAVSTCLDILAILTDIYIRISYIYIYMYIYIYVKKTE